MYTGTTAILTDGNVTSLIATASVCSHADRGSLVLIAFARYGSSVSHWRELIAAQAEKYHASEVVELAVKTEDTASKWFDTQAMVAAMGAASLRKVETIVWPLQCDTNLDTIGTATEATILIRQLAELSDLKPPVIDTPLIELTNKQMIELGGHLQTPWELAWSCELASDVHCGACDGCRKRRRLFATAGMTDPIFNPQLQAR